MGMKKNQICQLRILYPVKMYFKKRRQNNKSYKHLSLADPQCNKCQRKFFRLKRVTPGGNLEPQEWVESTRRGKFQRLIFFIFVHLLKAVKCKNNNTLWVYNIYRSKICGETSTKMREVKRNYTLLKFLHYKWTATILGYNMLRISIEILRTTTEKNEYG